MYSEKVDKENSHPDTEKSEAYGESSKLNMSEAFDILHPLEIPLYKKVKTKCSMNHDTTNNADVFQLFLEYAVRIIMTLF